MVIFDQSQPSSMNPSRAIIFTTAFRRQSNRKSTTNTPDRSRTRKGHRFSDHPTNRRSVPENGGVAVARMATPRTPSSANGGRGAWPGKAALRSGRGPVHFHPAARRRRAFPGKSRGVRRFSRLLCGVGGSWRFSRDGFPGWCCRFSFVSWWIVRNAVWR